MYQKRQGLDVTLLMGTGGGHGTGRGILIKTVDTGKAESSLSKAAIRFSFDRSWGSVRQRRWGKTADRKMKGRS